MNEVITARGHPEVRGTHESTLEFTTDEFLTPGGDCIIGIAADTAPSEFAESFADACRDSESTIVARLGVAGIEQTITGRGDPALTFSSDRGAVIRTSDYIDERTIMLEADHAACDLDRALITALQGEATLEITLSVHS